jgi:hypothetical protein
MSFSCIAQTSDKQDKYKILSFITNQITKIETAVPYPPRPNNLYDKKEPNKPLSYQDSSKMEGIHQKKLDKKYIVAIDLVQEPYFGNSNQNPPDTCQEFSTLYHSFLDSKKKEEINLDYIDLQRNDSLVYFKSKFEIKNRKDYVFIDKRVIFSNIEFDKKFSRAILQVSYSTSKLSGISLIYFLEKTDKKWQIDCEKGISIW